MKTTDYAINRVYAIITGSAMTESVYKLVKPTKVVKSKYIVLNSLPINQGVLQRCYINVNYHVKDLSSGIPDISTLETGTAALMALLTTNSQSGILIDFESQEFHKEESLSEHYSNIRLSVKIINT